MPLGEAVLEATRVVAAREELGDGFVGIDAVRATAVGDDVGVARELAQMAAKFGDGHRTGAEYVSRFGTSGSCRPPRLRLITRAPLSAAQRIAFASATGEIVPSERTTLATINWAGKAIPAIPCPLSSEAAMIPATNVP